MRHILYIIATTSLFWILNSGHYDMLMLILGAVSVAFVAFLAHRMDVVDHESHSIRLSLKLPKYLIWLAKEIVNSNLTVVKHIWLGPSTISPTLKTIRVSQTTSLGKVIYANSITTTPGTVTVDLKDDRFLVHSLLEGNIKTLMEGKMDRKVSQLERE